MRKMSHTIFCLCLIHSLSSMGQSFSNSRRSKFFKENKLTISAYGGYSIRTIDNSKTYLSTFRNNAKEINYDGYKMGLQVSLTSNDDDYILNKLNTGIRGDIFNLNAKNNYSYSENISLYYVGLIQGGSYAITKSAKSSLKLELSIGYSQFKDALNINTQKNKLSGSGLGYGISLFLSFELSESLYLNVGGEILKSNISGKILTTPNLTYSRSSEDVTFTTALFSISKVL